MANGGEIRMSTKEVKRVGILQRLLEGEITQVNAGRVIGVSDRHVRRLIERFEAEGELGLIHRGRGKPGHRRIKEKGKILEICARKYSDFGPTFASEKLLEIEKINIGRETLRGWLLEKSSEYEWRRKKRPHKKWRERKECFGEMIQVDGSHHDWLEGRGPKLVLMSYVDDATGHVYGRFYEYEGVKPALDSIYRYTEKYGIPQSIYIDRHSTYKTTRIQSIFEQLMDKEAMTQFQRAMKEVGVEIIFAYSPQAKGRVENKYKTFQDRLVKEMRLAGVKTKEEANKFLDKYLPKFNKRFSVLAKSDVDLHRKVLAKDKLDAILCIKEERSLRRDSTVRYNKKVYLITNRISNRVSRVMVEERLDGSIRIKHKDRYLDYKEIEPRVKVSEDKLKLGKQTIKWRKYNKNSRPAKYHPWRTRKSSDYHLDLNEFSDIASEELLAKMA